MAAKLSCEAVAQAVLGAPLRKVGRELAWRCPNHHDTNPSLQVNPGKNVWLCGPCGTSGSAWSLAAFLANLDPSDKAAVGRWLRERGLLNGGGKRKRKSGERGPVVAEYVYPDADTGELVLIKRRYEPGENGVKKSFAWFHRVGDKWEPGYGGHKPSLYRAERIAHEMILVGSESEKDADFGQKIGLATFSWGGADNWRDELAGYLRGKQVIIVAHCDEAGRHCGQQVAASLYRTAASVKVIEIPGAKDLAEAIEKGITREALLALFEETPEWKPSSGAEILNSVMGFIRRFVSLSESQARAVTLWIAHTHAFGAADATPYLAVNSAEKQSGKTRLLEVLRLLVHRPWFTGRTTAAVLVRKIDAEQPTLLLDESDAAFGGQKDYAEALRGVLNSGYRRGGAASCCLTQGKGFTYYDFSTFCPKVIAGIGRLPDTVADRSIPIRLKRARRGEVERFRERDAGHEAAGLKARLAVWAEQNLETLRNAQPSIPDALSDRQADCCEPPLAIADLAGGDWPVTARQALVKLCVGAQAQDDSIGVQLLRDIRSVFAAKQVDELPSAELTEALAEIETSPWGEWNHGKPLTTAKLARLLRPFDIFPCQLRTGQARGYRLTDFEEVFSLYLPLESVKVSETQYSCGPEGNLKVSNEKSSDTLKNELSLNVYAPSRHFDTLEKGNESAQTSEKAPISLKGLEIGEKQSENAKKREGVLF